RKFASPWRIALRHGRAVCSRRMPALSPLAGVSTIANEFAAGPTLTPQPPPAPRSAAPLSARPRGAPRQSLPPHPENPRPPPRAPVPPPHVFLINPWWRRGVFRRPHPLAPDRKAFPSFLRLFLIRLRNL